MLGVDGKAQGGMCRPGVDMLLPASTGAGARGHSLALVWCSAYTGRQAAQPQARFLSGAALTPGCSRLQVAPAPSGDQTTGAAPGLTQPSKLCRRLRPGVRAAAPDRCVPRSLAIGERGAALHDELAQLPPAGSLQVRGRCGPNRGHAGGSHNLSIAAEGQWLEAAPLRVALLAYSCSGRPCHPHSRCLCSAPPLRRCLTLARACTEGS